MKTLKVAWRSLCGTYPPSVSEPRSGGYSGGVSPVRALALVAVVGWAFTASADIPASAYVQDGLVVQYDGIDNAGTGAHDVNARTWKDLKGQGGDMPLGGLTSPVWDGKGLSFSACGIYNSTVTTEFLCTPNVLKLGDEFTIQMFCNTGDKYDCRRWDVVPYANSYETWTSSDEGFLERINNANRFSLKPWVSNADIIFTTVVGDKKHRFMIEPIGGTAQSVEGNLPSCVVNNRLAFMKTNGSNVPRKDCYSIRIYSRALTADEIAFNANIDKLRFEGGVDGVRYENGRLEYRVNAVASEGGSVAVGDGTEAWGAGEEEAVIVATPAEGHAFVCWQGDISGLTEEQLKSSELTVAFGDKPRTLTAAFKSIEEFGSYDYAQDGLVFQLDGIENAGRGTHDAEATEWIDLASGIKIPLTENDTVGEKFTQLVTSKSFSGFKDVKTTETFTVEVCQRSTVYLGTDINQYLTFQIGGRCYLGYYGKPAAPGVSTLVGISSDGTFKTPHPMYGVDNGILRNLTQTNAHTIAAVARIGSFDAWFDGQPRPHGTASVSSGWASADGAGAIGNATAKPEYYAVRVYNRALTNAELARHARLDRIRFFGADEGMRPSADGDEYRVRVTTPDGSVADAWYAKGEAANLSYSPRVGETFRFWKPAPEGVDRTQTSISFEVNEPLSTVARIVDDPSRLTAGSYVREGLVLQFDGIANAGIDEDGDELHDGQSIWWKDLSGEGQDAYVVKFDTNIHWTEDACDQMAAGYMVGAYFAFPIGDKFYAAQNDLTGSTVQMAGRKRLEGAGLNCYTHLVGYKGGWSLYMPDLGSGLTYYVGGVGNKFTNAKASTNMAVTVSFTTEGAPAGNGFLRRWFGSDDYAQSAVSTTAMKDLTGRTGNIFGVGYYDQGFILRAARFYNRVLTDYERLLNTRIDEERFYGTNATRIVSVESESSNFGEPKGWGYGAYRVEPGETVSCSFTDSLELFDDGIRALPITDGERTGLAGYTVSNRVSVSYGNPTASAFEGMANDDFRLIWHWRHQYRLDYTSSAGGTVACVKPSGGWHDEGISVTLTAQPDDDHVFAGWAGTTVGIADLSAATITVPVDRARALSAVFQEKHHTPVELSWQGGETGRWSDPANWGGVLPQVGDFVTVGEGVEVSLDTATPVLGSLTLQGTIEATGWGNSINAEMVTVGNGGVITCAGEFGSMSEVSNRVWIVCGDLTVAQGGRIDVTGKGWKAAPGEFGAGPGAGTVAGCGGAYGGFAGSGYIGYEDCTQMRMPYGDPLDPRDPGSAGSAAKLANVSFCGGSGGGAVLVEATGAVTLNGQIVANGTNGVGDWSGGGSGGSVSIHCATIGGLGSVSARGGSQCLAHGGNGSGGRIAVRYDREEQAKLERPGLVFDAGTPTSSSAYSYEISHGDGEGGTVWLPDASLLVPEAFNVTGQVLVDGAVLSLPTLVIDSRRVAFTQDGFKLTVTGDVTLQGTGAATLELGGSLLIHRGSTCTGSTSGFRRFGDQSPIDIRIGGNFSIGGSRGEVILRAAKMTEEDANPEDCRPVGGTLKVGGTLSVAKNSRLVTVSHYCTGVSPRIECGNFVLAEGATVTASSQGYYAGNPSAALPLDGQKGTLVGFGPGAPVGYANGYDGAGASHIGLGGFRSETLPDTFLYDSSEMPHMPGSGCCSAYNCGCDAAGGGVVFLEVEGRCRLLGKVLANGSTQGSGHAASCAGGAIYIKTRKLYLAPTAVVQAKGGTKSGSGGSGGGGGVALYRVFDQSGSALTSSTTAEELITAGIASAPAGDVPDETHHQSNGSVYLGQLPKPGLTILVK